MSGAEFEKRLSKFYSISTDSIEETLELKYILTQSQKFKVLEELVSELFANREFAKDISNSIISFLSISNRKKYVDIFSEIEDIPYEKANSEVQSILKSEFL